MPDLEDWLSFYASDDSAIKLRAAKQILRRAEEAPLAILLDILDNLSRQRLGFAVRQVLLDRKDPELFGEMTARLKAQDPWTRATACAVLGHLGDRSATPDLIAMMDDPDLSVRRDAAYSLGKMGDPTAIPALERQLTQRKNDNINLVIALRVALEALGVPPPEGENVTDRPK